MTGGEALPILESGDRLDRDEFHRRYTERTDLRAELVGGVVYVAHPSRLGALDRQHGLVVHWLTAYTRQRSGVHLAEEATLFLGEDTEVQPDALLFVEPPPPGGAWVREDGFIEGAPRLIVEVVASRASYALHDKRRAYEAAGVPEYAVWRVGDAAVDWLRSQDGRYQPVQLDGQSIIESMQFPGLRLDVAALLAGNVAAVMDALRSHG